VVKYIGSLLTSTISLNLFYILLIVLNFQGMLNRQLNNKKRKLKKYKNKKKDQYHFILKNMANGY
jgi:hypothetical protein